MKKNIEIGNIRKLNKTLAKQIDTACDRLVARVEEYRRQGIDICRVFNDDILVHDIINKKFYVYKCKVGDVQLRLLYTVRDDCVNILAFYNKNNSNRCKNSCKEYIRYFEDFVCSYTQKAAS